MKFGEQLDGLTWISENMIEYQGYRVKLTSLYEQILDAKKQYPSAILMIRVGDFYETFFEDAKIISRALDITLTSRNKSAEGDDVPLAGVPYRTINEYLFQLVEQGFNVAVCDQLEDPSTATGSVVRRGITQIVTPGTLCDERPGVDRMSRFLTAVVWNESKKKSATQPILCALASIDVSTGYCTMTEVSSEQSLQAELMRLNVREVISHHGPHEETMESLMRGIPITYRDRGEFGQQALLSQWQYEANGGLTEPVIMSKEKFLSFLDLIGQAEFEQTLLVSDAFCGLLMYLRDLRFPLTANIERIYPYRSEAFMQIDAATFQNLEIYQTLRGGQRTGSLLGEIDDTVTGGGSRLLQNWLAYPLKNSGQIKTRLDAVSELVDKFEVRDRLRNLLGETSDLERLATKVANDRIMPRELVMLKRTLKILPDVKKCCEECGAGYLLQAAQRLMVLDRLAATIENALVEDAPGNLNDTNFFKSGYDEQLDHYREISANGQQWLLNYEAKQRAETGINSLKVKYHRVFGYYIDITKANLSLVPDHYIRSQTLTNSDRFYTPELKEYEEELLSSEERKGARELELFAELKRLVSGQLAALMKDARILAHLDVLCSLAHTAHHRQYTRPEILDDKTFDLKGARHPVVERFLPKGERFVPNDIFLDENGRLIIITGPNMAGKSTIIRQAAIIALMAQIGSFVPAESARIGIVDRIFSRVGASDNLALGQSTFMVEMTETANILTNATDRSLVILDEIGRGTSTYDGLSLAWAIAEYLHTKIGARALFATHYHELTELSNVMKGVKNMSIAVKEYKKEIIFLRKLIEGAANRSYGIQVARLAGIPGEVLTRAEEILGTLETNAHRELVPEVSNSPRREPVAHIQRSLFGDAVEVEQQDMSRYEEIVKDLKGLMLDTTTPIQALNYLYKLQKKTKNL